MNSCWINTFAICMCHLHLFNQKWQLIHLIFFITPQCTMCTFKLKWETCGFVVVICRRLTVSSIKSKNIFDFTTFDPTGKHCLLYKQVKKKNVMSNKLLFHLVFDFRNMKITSHSENIMENRSKILSITFMS